MIHELEEKTQERVAEKIDSVRDVKIQKGGIQQALVNPAVYAACEKGSFKRLAKGWKQGLDLYVELEFKHLQSEKERRKGATIIVEAIFQFLIGQTFDLDIDPLEPIDWEHITDEDDVKAGLIRFQMLFKTACFVSKLEEEETGDLLRVGLDYIMKPGDEVADLHDVVELEQCE
jgi:hypothetical protein